MKLRLKDNSVRIRITRTEVERFAVEKYIEAVTDFGDAVLKYGMKWNEHVNELNATMTEQTIILQIPSQMASEFVSTDIVGFQHTVTLPGGRSLFILFEKDFKCLDGNLLEDESDNYENPSASCKQ